MRRSYLAAGAAALAVAALAVAEARQTGDRPTSGSRSAMDETETETRPKGPTVKKTDAEWRRQLSNQEYYVTRKKGTEPAFTGRYWNFHGDGIYRCVCCANPLFDSETKFASGTGWPSFYRALGEGHVVARPDRSGFMVRTEVLCRTCGAHLGHVFRDGPPPTGLRFCMNSASLRFQPRAEALAQMRAEAEAKAEEEAKADAEEDEKTEGETAESPAENQPAPPAP